MRYLTGVLILIVASLGCSRNPERAVVESPTAPSAVAGGRTSLLFGDIGSAPGRSDLIFAPRDAVFTFFLNLDGRYQRMGRGQSAFYIDREGLAVWIPEFIRYRVSGCDQSTSIARVVVQIAGGIAGGVCAEPPAGVVEFPSRADTLAAVIQFDGQYQRMGRGQTQMFVDLEGAVVWIQEFLRYVMNACDVATAEQKVFLQVDGGPVPPTCFVACSYRVTPERVDAGAGPFTASFEIRPPVAPTDPRSCDWRVSSDQSWLTVPSDFATGNGFLGNIPYSVARNDGGDRVGRIRVTWTGGEATLTINQEGSPFFGNLVMRDPPRGGNDDVTECHVRTASTSCTLIATTNLPGNTYTYSWVVQYTYGNDKSSTAFNNSSTFTVTDQCGGNGSGTEGPGTTLAVTVTISDDRGNSITIRRDFVIRFFTC